jgi:hypothetical protein
MIRFLGICTVAAALVPAAMAQEPEATPVIRVHDVRDLSAAIRDFPPIRLGIQRQLPAPPTPAATKAASTPLARLVTAIRAIAGIAWPKGTAIDAKAGQLVVRQVPSAHRAIERFLAARRRDRGWMVTVQTTFIALDSPQARKLPAGLHVIDGSQAARLIALAKAGERATLLTAPKITAFENQLANISVANQKSYISHFDIRVQRGMIVASPVIDTITEGVVLAVRARRASKGWIAIDLDAQRATLLRPLPQVKTRYGTVQVPELVPQRVRASGRIPDGGWALLAGLIEVQPGGASGRPVVTLVHVRSVQLKSRGD